MIKRDTKRKCRIQSKRHSNTYSTPKVAGLYVEKDLSGIVKGIFDNWDTKKDELNHKVLYCADARVSPSDVIAILERRMFTFLP